MKTSLHLGIVVIAVPGILVAGAQSSIGGLLVNILAAAIVVLLEYLVITRTRFRILFKTLFRRDRIRLSFSYLIRIRLHDKYLLVAGNRIKGQFQPVGGVYKKVVGSIPELENLGVRNDKKLAGDSDDLRINVAARYVLSVVDWFEQNRQRESTPIREFVEELLEEGVIAADEQCHFRWAFFSYIRRHSSGIQYSTQLQTRELLISDIYELIPTPEQEAALSRIVNSAAAQWVSEDEIIRQGHVEGGETVRRISNNAVWLLPSEEH